MNRLIKLFTLILLLFFSLNILSLNAENSNYIKSYILAKNELSKTIKWKKYISLIDNLFVKIWDNIEVLEKLELKVSNINKKFENDNSTKNKIQKNVFLYLYWKVKISIEKIDKNSWKNSMTVNNNSNLQEEKPTQYCLKFLTQEWVWKLNNELDVIFPDKSKLTTIEDWCNISSLTLRANTKEVLPEEVWYLQNITDLTLFWGYLKNIPEEIFQLKNIEKLNLMYSSTPENIINITNFEKLNGLRISDKTSKVIPKIIFNLKNLTYLWIEFPELTELPLEIWNMTKLKNLEVTHSNNIVHSKLKILPPEIWNLSNLESINLHNNDLETLPPEIWKLSNLKLMFLRWNNLKTLPKEIVNLNNLSYLDLSDNEYLGDLSKTFENNLSNPNKKVYSPNGKISIVYDTTLHKVIITFEDK